MPELSSMTFDNSSKYFSTSPNESSFKASAIFGLVLILNDKNKKLV